MPAKFPRLSLTRPQTARIETREEPRRKAAWLDANRPGLNASELQQLVFAELAGCWRCGRRARWLWTPQAGSTWKDYAVEVLTERIGQELAHLRALGDAGDGKAITSFALLTDRMVQALNSWAVGERQPVLQQVAMKRFAWPMRIGTRKPFGDDVERLKTELKLGRDTIAADPNARFNPASKFGKVAMELLDRIERWRTYPKDGFVFGPIPEWAREARELPAFSQKALPAERVKWQTVVKKLLDEDFKDSKLANSYRLLVSAPSHKRRWKGVFRNKVLSEFDSLWGMHRPTRS
jgi:hypothetical protein